eukprot:6972632-Prymnesium_polylepis.2
MKWAWERLSQLLSIATVLCHRHQRGGSRALIITPLSLMQQWKAELMKHTADDVRFTEQDGIIEDNVVVFHRTGDLTSSEALSQICTSDREIVFVITNYQSILHHPRAFNREWDWLVADEAHTFRNPKTRTFKRMYQLRSASRLALSGTPFQNRCVAPDSLSLTMKEF